jgi:ribosome-binding ATPase YchF (GTP1/OBG family)
MVRAGGEPEAKRQALTRTEGKGWIVEDGSVFHVLFNV